MLIIQPHLLSCNTPVLQCPFLSPLIIFTHSFTFSLIQTKHKTQHFHHRLSSAPASPTTKLELTELSAVSYFFLSLDCSLLSLYIQGLQLTWPLGYSVSFKNFSLFRFLCHPPQGPDFYYSLQATLPIFSVPVFHREKWGHHRWQSSNPRTPFYEISTSSPPPPYFQIQWKRCPSLNEVYPSVLLKQLI